MKIRVLSQITYKKESERPKIDLVIKKLKSEGWKIAQPELHKEGLNLHVVYLKKLI